MTPEKVEEPLMREIRYLDKLVEHSTNVCDNTVNDYTRTNQSGLCFEWDSYQSRMRR